VVSNIGQLVPNITVCPVCSTNYFTRTRLVQHLSEKRIRSKVRKTSCRLLFLDSKPNRLGTDTINALQLAAREVLRVARKQGRTHERASRPALRSAPHILKGIKASSLTNTHFSSPTVPDILSNPSKLSEQPRFRLLGKSPRDALFHSAPCPKRRRLIGKQSPACCLVAVAD
jgi:hypothetical protein